VGPRSTLKWDWVKLNRMLMSSSSVRAASTTMPRSVLRRASASGTEAPPAWSRPREVAALAPEEGRADDLRPVEAVADSGRLQLGGDPLRRQRRITARVGVGRVPGEVAEHRLDEGGDVVDRVVEAAEAVGGFDRGCLEVGIDEFDVRVDAEGGEDPPGDRVEERLGELPVLPAGDQPRVDGLRPRPDDGVGDPLGEERPEPPSRRCR